MPNKILFEDDSDDDIDKNGKNKLSVNHSYAENYERWRRKEDYQELKDKYGDVAADSDSESESSSDETLVEPDNPEFDMDFFRVLAAVRLKHPIVSEDRKFFKDSYQSTSGVKPSKSQKPFTVEDYEKKLILESGGKYDEDEEEDEEVHEKKAWKNSCFSFGGESMEENFGPGSSKQKFVFDHGSSDDDDDGELFTKRKKDASEEQEERSMKEERWSKKNEAVEFLQGRKNNLNNKLDEELLTGLKQQWQTNMSKKDQYLMDYFVNQRYLDPEDDNMERAPNHFVLNVESLEEDEKTFDKMQEYETKYRFRFEEPDQEFIRRHPRVVEESVRNTDTKRKDLRDKKKLRQEQERERREQELKRLKSWKKKEILEKIDELKKVAGFQEEGAFEEIDLDADFDPDQHDAAMANMFDDTYYNEEAEDSDSPNLQDEELNRELREEYEKLEQMDNMSEGTFRYVDVFANNYGLTTEEILFAKDKELNTWYSLKKMHQHGRDTVMEKRELKNFAHRGQLEHVKAKLLPSLYAENLEEQWEAEEARRKRRNLKKKERRIRKMAGAEASAATTNTEMDGDTSIKLEPSDCVEEINHEEYKDLAVGGKNRLEEEPNHDGGSCKQEKSSDETPITSHIVHNNKRSKGKKRKRDDSTGLISDPANHQPEKKPKVKRREREVAKPKRKDSRLKGISDNRLAAYGQDPNKVKKMFRYDRNVKKGLKKSS